MKIFELEVCTSTNDEAWKYIDGSEPVLVIVRRQKQGRGTQGRIWNDGVQITSGIASGNLMASLGFIPHSQKLIKRLSGIPLIAGAATIEAIEQTCSGLTAKFDQNKSLLHLKWPNDIMFRDAKMGGILCESRMSGNECLGIVIGLGLNIMQAPSLDVKTASIWEDLLEKSEEVGPPKLASLRVSLVKLWAKLLLEKINSFE